MLQYTKSKVISVIRLGVDIESDNFSADDFFDKFIPAIDEHLINLQYENSIQQYLVKHNIQNTTYGHNLFLEIMRKKITDFSIFDETILKIKSKPIWYKDVIKGYSIDSYQWFCNKCNYKGSTNGCFDHSKSKHSAKTFGDVDAYKYQVS